MMVKNRWVLRWIGMASLMLNAGIHVYLTPDHLVEMPYMGVLFLVAAGLLGIVVLGLSSGRGETRFDAWLLGTLVCAGMFVAFVLSRTVGLPSGYHEGWASNGEDVAGLICLLLELVFIGCAAGSVRKDQRVRPGERATPVP